MTDQHTCPKCGSRQTRVIGRSVTPPMTYVECSACGYSTSIAGAADVAEPAPPAAPSPEKDAPRLEQLARRLVADLGLRLDVVGVTRERDLWNVEVRTEAGRSITLAVKAAAPSVMRMALKDALLTT
jgi:hypothetical protein